MGFSVTVLGSSATFPRPGNPCSGYLLRSPQAMVWADCGPGTFAALQQHADPRELTALWISHLHPDHWADVLSLFNWIVNTPDSIRPPVYGPAGWADRLAAMLPTDNANELVRHAFDVHELHDHHTTQIGDQQVRSLAVKHGVPAFGLRIEHDAHVLAYSGDTGPCPTLIELAHDADLFLCEAGATEPQPTHLTPTEAGHAATQAGARRLALTHLAHPSDESHAIADASRTAVCPVEAVRPGQCIPIVQ